MKVTLTMTIDNVATHKEAIVAFIKAVLHEPLCYEVVDGDSTCYVSVSPPADIISNKE